MAEKTVVVCTPDAFMRGVVDQIKSRYTNAGLRIIVTHTHKMEKETASRIYASHQGQSYYEGLVCAITSDYCVAILLEGENAVERVLEINGPTHNAPLGTIRGDFPSAGGPFNMVHAPKCRKTAAREVGILFFGQ